MDLATAQANLAALEAAYESKALVRSYTIGNRTMVNPSEEELREAITYWQRVCDAYTAEAAGSSMSVVTAKWSS